MTEKELCRLAIKNMKNAYAPYSNFKVGAALLTKSGKVFSGANVENASYSATICAERTAFCTAIVEGEKEFTAIAIAGGKGGCLTKITPPCGICLQFMSEFCDNDFKILLLQNEENYKTYTLGDFLPNSFKMEKQ